MRDKFIKILEYIFGVCMAFAIAGGGIIFLIMIISFIIGGGSGEALADAGMKTYMPLFIRGASVAVLAGLLIFYISGRHKLTLSDEHK